MAHVGSNNPPTGGSRSGPLWMANGEHFVEAIATLCEKLIPGMKKVLFSPFGSPIIFLQDFSLSLPSQNLNGFNYILHFFYVLATDDNHDYTSSFTWSLTKCQKHT